MQSPHNTAMNGTQDERPLQWLEPQLQKDHVSALTRNLTGTSADGASASQLGP